MREAVILSAVRTPIGRAKSGLLRELRAEDLGAAALKEAVRRIPGWASDVPDDCLIGCAEPDGGSARHFARACSLLAGFPVSVPAMTVNRSCASGLQAVALAASAVASGAAGTVLAGGAESMSRWPGTRTVPSPNPELLDRMASAYMAAGHAAELLARRRGISREAQDRYAADSFRKAREAAAAGKLRRQIAPLGACRTVTDEEGYPHVEWISVEEDECLAQAPEPDQLGSLPPAFAAGGTVTDGNSAPPTDGAAALIVATRELAERLEVRPLAALRGYAVTGSAPETAGLAAAEAVPKALEQAGLASGQIAQWEIHEGFAVEALLVIDRLEIDPGLVNVNGGAIAFGHPAGCSGARMLVSLIHELSARGGGFGVAAMGAWGGMGAAAVLEVF
ncbi:thiolase family protein [Cohnella candidum]|uniref:Thiolase family protein n=1 Tax=Cohnella candidum TaxID=2674991 RepID=A0A3G3K4U9_9BACL|nr:thiolase family protein [Cohnella candidum]AYQ75087.1 thiolase family protein [Cohnella candidum]